MTKKDIVDEALEILTASEAQYRFDSKFKEFEIAFGKTTETQRREMVEPIVNALADRLFKMLSKGKP